MSANLHFSDDQFTRGLTLYLVGGAVRDGLMGRVVRDRDWVVTGSSAEDMLQRGFKPVGRDFPVFLHPRSGEEYALARTERKVSAGYHGFTWHADPSVSLEQDLLRRDLTINAMARTRDGRLVDPCNGQRDLDRQVLRHVSTAFTEDPVRVLRVARFAARFCDPRYAVAEDTTLLMQQMAANGELNALVAERVWQELASALSHAGFFRFIEVLRSAGALTIILPEVDALFGVPQRPEFHPEIDTGRHILLALQAAARLHASPMEVFAVLTHDLGKALTPATQLPAHRGHEQSGLKPIDMLCDRLGVPTAYRQLALRVCEFHLQMHRLDELRPATLLKLLERLDGFRNPENIQRFARCCQADLQGREGYQDRPYPQAEMLAAVYQAAAAVDGKEIADQVKAGPGRQAVNPGPKIAEALRRARIAAIRDCRRRTDGKPGWHTG